ncbi:MAG: hypothetical protein LQ342_005498 [Letrouitia transgressa]|nr:MAG: hypothetical protein LQ342_005498 [Letrouitia transgressa]
MHLTFRKYAIPASRAFPSFHVTSALSDHDESILLYRALLRQSSYLPDSAARSYVRSYVISRFRGYYPRKKSADGHPIIHHQPNLSDERLRTVLKSARKSLKILQRANDGHLKQLTKVLSMTYGRTGKRKRQIVGLLQSPLSAAKANTTYEFNGSGLSDELQAVIRVQVKQPATNFLGRALKDQQPNIPKESIWQRPLSKTRQKNVRKKWLAKTLDKIMPPLGEQEWNRLRDLALGTTKWEGPIAPRPKGRPLFNTSSEIIEDIQPKLNAIIGPWIPKRLTSSTERIVEDGRHPDFKSRPHKLTAKYMRGIWRAIFRQCPKLHWDNKAKNWQVTWGDVEREQEIVLNTTMNVGGDMFEKFEGDE